MDIDLALSALAEERIAQLARDSVDGRETGGILLGHDVTVSRLEVIAAGEAGPHAERRRDFFRRDLNAAARFAADMWASRRMVWVGEWHTHLNGWHAPSHLDLETYRRFLADPSLGFDVFVALIVVATDGDWRDVQIVPWLVYSDSLMLVG